MGVIARTYGHCVRHWTHDEATAALPDVREKVHRIREMLDAAREQEARTDTNGHGEGPSSNGHGGATREAAAAEIAALIAELQADGIVVRDPERGLIDFPAPLGPRRPITLPAGTSRSTSSSTIRLPKRCETPRTSRTGSTCVTPAVW